jgi:DNA adenine methylase
MTEEHEHEKLLEALKMHSGPVLISGYDSELYNDLLRGWYKKEIETSAEQGKKRIEVIWTNYPITEQLSIFNMF